MQHKNTSEHLESLTFEEAIGALVGWTIRQKFHGLRPAQTWMRDLYHQGKVRRWKIFLVPSKTGRSRYYLAARTRIASQGVVARHFDADAYEWAVKRGETSTLASTGTL